MILRRITQHVKEQNWFAVALDFFIVVVGILIAFQITNWNEERETRAEETEIVQRISEDFERIKVDAARGREFYEQIAGDMKTLVQSLRSETLKEENIDAVKRALYHGWIIQSSADRSATTSELLSSGRANILRDKSLLDELVAYNMFLDRHEQALDYLVALLQDLRTTTHGTFQYDLESPFFSEESLSVTKLSPPIDKIDFEAMKSNAKFRDATEQRLFLQNLALMWRIRIDNRIESIQRRLEAN